MFPLTKKKLESPSLSTSGGAKPKLQNPNDISQDFEGEIIFLRSMTKNCEITCPGSVATGCSSHVHRFFALTSLHFPRPPIRGSIISAADSLTSFLHQTIERAAENSTSSIRILMLAEV
ncbi:hypothetical protein NPIL_43101 [Nephila pilipes]|uniref:Uncharacterized protein n=1 Tax=Nephila pilipes TaxID=299642 RepID=A0A8X6QND5_NEPPI|nr:hypothetical protein NPIL_43101 [Nephila pilipes]